MRVVAELLHTEQLSDEALRALAINGNSSLQERISPIESPQEYTKRWVATFKKLMAAIKTISNPGVDLTAVLSGTFGIQLRDGIDPVHAGLSDPHSLENSPRRVQLLRDGYAKAKMVFGETFYEYGGLIPHMPGDILRGIYERHQQEQIFMSPEDTLYGARVLVEGISNARDDTTWKEQMKYARPIMRAIIDPQLFGRA